MAHTTTRRGLRVPDLTDNPDVVRDITNLGLDVDAAMASLITGTLAGRPTSGEHDGDVYWAYDDTTMSPNGTPYKWDNTNGQWRIWAPPVDPVAAQGGSRTLGTGAQQAAAGNDSRLSDARTPLAHAASHRPGGSDELAHLAASALQVKDVGISGQLRAGRVFVPADFTTLLGLSNPIALYNLADLTDASGNGRSLTNKGAVTFGSSNGIVGTNAVATFFGGSTTALYRSGDTAFSFQTGSIGVWFKTAKRATIQDLVSKWAAAAGANLSAYVIYVDSNNHVIGAVAPTGDVSGGNPAAIGATDVCDDRWHFAVVTFDGTQIRVYIDGQLDGVGGPAASGQPLTSGVSSAPFNIGGQSADASTNSGNPFYGRIDEVFVTSDVISEDGQRLLYAAKLAHGLSVTPNIVTVNTRRRRKGAALVQADFPTSVRRLYNFTAGSMSDAGLDGAALSLSGGAAVVAAPDGASSGAYQLASAGSQYLSATDTGLPALATAARVLGGWFKTASSGTAQVIAAYGSVAAGAGLAFYVDTNGVIAAADGTSSISGPQVNDGQWHFAAFVEDPNEAAGLKWRLYLDGKLVASSTAAVAAITLAGAGGFRIGRDRGANTNYFTGSISRVFAADYALTMEQINSLFYKGSQQLPASPKNEGDHIEGVDATNLYIIGDTLDGAHALDLRVAA